MIAKIDKSQLSLLLMREAQHEGWTDYDNPCWEIAQKLIFCLWKSENNHLKNKLLLLKMYTDVSREKKVINPMCSSSRVNNYQM